LAYLLLYAGLALYVDYRASKAKADWKFVLLALDIPALNVQTPKAVEQLFAHIAGAYEVRDIADVYYHGIKQRPFSFEIISIEGYIQFLIYIEQKYRELVEAAVYAQYPEAEIVEVEDYTGDIPSAFPNDSYNIWGADFGLEENDAFPIRTYKEFEHNISKDTVLKDPMGTFLESFSKLGEGEQMWFQIILEPISNSWKEKSIEKIKDLIGEKKKVTKNIGDHVSGAVIKTLEKFGDEVFGREASVGGEKEDNGPLNQLQFLTPGQKKIVEAMEDKISKIGFKTKMRGIYIARKEVFRPSRGISCLIGAINQYNIPSANSIVKKYDTDASYIFKNAISNRKKSLIMGAYKKRKISAGANTFVLNIEELATVWHFPMSHVKTPLVQKAEGKRVEPPSTLPIEVFSDLKKEEEKKEEKSAKMYHTDSGAFGYDDDFKFG
jgi:hypothetical protein